MKSININEIYLYLLLLIVFFTAPIINRYFSIQILFLIIVLLLLILVRGYISLQQLRTPFVIYLIWIFGFIYLFNYSQGYLKYFIKEFYFINILLFLIIIFNRFGKSNLTTIRIVKFIVYIGTIISIYCIFEYLFQRNILFSNYFDYKNVTSGFNIFYRVSGSLHHPIPMSGFSMVITFLAFYLGKHEEKMKYYIFSIINFAALFLTFSRSALIALVLSFIIYKFLVIFLSIISETNTSLSKIFYRLLRLIILSTLVFVVANFVKINGINLYDIISERFLAITTSEDMGSFYQRYYGVQFVMDEMFNKANLIELFFGKGHGSLIFDLESKGTTIYGENFFLIDNQYFTLFYNTGIFGFSILLFSILGFIIKHLKTIIKESSNFERDLLPLVCLLSILVHMFFYEGMTYISNVTLLSLVLSLCISFSRRNLIKYKEK